MLGKVISITPNGEMIIVKVLNDGSYSILELFGDTVSVGDILRGDFRSLGGENFYNVTQSEKLSACVQDYDVAF